MGSRTAIRPTPLVEANLAITIDGDEAADGDGFSHEAAARLFLQGAFAPQSPAMMQP